MLLPTKIKNTNIKLDTQSFYLFKKEKMLVPNKIIET